MREVLDSILDRNDPLYKMLMARLAGYEGFPIENLSTFYVDTLFHMVLGSACSADKKFQKEFITVKGGNALLAEKMADTLEDRLHLTVSPGKDFV